MNYELYNVYTFEIIKQRLCQIKYELYNVYFAYTFNIKQILSH